MSIKGHGELLGVMELVCIGSMNGHMGVNRFSFLGLRFPCGSIGGASWALRSLRLYMLLAELGVGPSRTTSAYTVLLVKVQALYTKKGEFYCI